MNLLVKKLRISRVVILVSLFFVSCEDPGKIGLNINPKNGSVVSKYIEFVLPSSQVQFNPRSTLNSVSFQAGTYTDPDFGTITSKSFTWLGVQNSVPTLSQTATYKSISLSIQFSSIYGSEAENQEKENFEIYQLADEIIPGSDYTRVDDLALGDLLGTLEIMIEDKVDTLATDSLFNLALTDTFGQSIFDKLVENDGTFEDDTIFNQLFKGIAIIPLTGNNKILQFNPSTFAIELGYTEINSAGEEVDRTYLFDLGSMRFFNLTSDLNGTPLAGLMPDNAEREPSDDFRYLQAGTMIAIKLDFEPLIMFVDTIENMVVQKAFLKVGDIPINKPGSAFPGSLTGYLTDDANTWPALAEISNDSISVLALLQEEFTTFGTPSFPGYYGNPQNIFLGQTDTLTYEATMSNFIQNLHGGGYDTSETPLEQGGNMLLFAPTSAAEPQSAPSHTLTNFFKVHKDSIKLEVYYSTPNL